MATPHVTGAVALYAAANPGATAAQIKAAILNHAVPTSSLAGRCVSGGRLNASTF
jgi:subtilisin family serine protease